MADKDVIIGLKTTGADAAAQNIRKLEESLGIVTKSEKDLAAARSQFLTAAEAEVAEVNRLVEANKKLDAAQDAVASNTSAAGKRTDQAVASNSRFTASQVNMRGAVQNTAFQLQDMAVQLEMGTSATRVLSQQVPQLLGGFGAVGAAAGAVIGIGVPLAAALFNTGKEAADATPKIDDLNKILEDHKEAVKDAADAKRAAENDAWLKSLDEEEAYYEKINSRLERQIALQAKLRALKEQTDAAEREARIAEIEADPAKSEIDKVREVAAIREEDARAKVEAQKKALEDESKLAASAAADAQARADRQAADAAAAAQRRAEAENQFAILDSKAIDAAKTGKLIPDLQRQLDQAQRGAAFSINPETGELGPGYQKFQQEVERLTAQLNAAKASAAAAPALAAAAEFAKTQLPDLRTGEETQRSQSEEARRAAEDAYGKSLTADAAFRLGSPQIDARAEAERRQRAARVAAAIRTAEERAKREAEREADQKRREAEAADNKRRSEEAGIGRDAKSLIPKGASESLRRSIETAAAALQDGDQGGELEAISEALQQLTQSALDNKANRDAMRLRIEQIQAQIKNLRNPATN